MIILTRSNGIYSSPRIEKYIDYYEQRNIDYLVVGWDRVNDNLKRKKTIYYRKKSGYNVGGIKAAMDRFKWMYFLLKIYYTYRKNLTAIHAFDLDTTFPSCLFKTLFKKNVTVIFDVCDWFSANLYNQNKFILWSFKRMERFSIKHSDEVIICEPERIEQIPYKLNRPELIVPNIPSFTDMSFLHYDDKYQFNNQNVTFAYVGGFSKFRMLDELLNIAEKGKINLLIAGYGSPDIEMRCNEASSLSNIRYFGKVDYKDGLNIMYNSDLVYAMYSKSNPNNYYAAPNKYYETMMIGKPILSTQNISLGNKIIENNIGYVIHESEKDLLNFVLNIDREDMSEKGKNAYALWEEKFMVYTSNFFNNKYSEIINNKRVYE